MLGLRQPWDRQHTSGVPPEHPRRPPPPPSAGAGSTLCSRRPRRCRCRSGPCALMGPEPIRHEEESWSMWCTLDPRPRPPRFKSPKTAGQSSTPQMSWHATHHCCQTQGAPRGTSPHLRHSRQLRSGQASTRRRRQGFRRRFNVGVNVEEVCVRGDDDDLLVVSLGLWR